MVLQVGVKVALKNREGKYLLLKRSPEKYPEVHRFGDVWDIVGGRIEIGTPLLENLKREVKEETGFELQSEPQLIAAQDILRLAEKHVVRLTYVAEVDGTPQLDEDHSEFGWFTIEEMKHMKDLDIYFTEVLKNESSQNLR